MAGHLTWQVFSRRIRCQSEGSRCSCRLVRRVQWWSGDRRSQRGRCPVLGFVFCKVCRRRLPGHSHEWGSRRRWRSLPSLRRCRRESLRLCDRLRAYGYRVRVPARSSRGCDQPANKQVKLTAAGEALVPVRPGFPSGPGLCSAIFGASSRCAGRRSLPAVRWAGLKAGGNAGVACEPIPTMV